MAREVEIEGVKFDKDHLDHLKRWVEDGFTFWQIIAKMAEDERLRATAPYSQKVPIDFTKAQREDAASKSWAFNNVLDVVNSIKEMK